MLWIALMKTLIVFDIGYCGLLISEVLLLPHKFVCLLYCYYYEIKTVQLGVAYSDIVFISDFIKIWPAAVKLKHTGGHMSYFYEHYAKDA
jgi:hypothetical protein